nr:MAG TPA: PRKC APOPTOSIS WT1 REGULATOR PROTEIN [Caudoviricetes sp.]
MENSIEENIKEIECFFKRNYFVNYDWTTIHRNSMANLEDSIEDILSDYKRVLKENEYLKEKRDKDTHILRNELDLINANRLDLLQQNKELRKENEEYKKFLEKTIKEYIPDYKLEELVNRYKNESFIPRVEVKKILEDRRK